MKSGNNTIELGEKMDEKMKGSEPSKSETIYPSLYLSGIKDHEAIKSLGDEGTATITYKKSSHSTSERNGEKTHSFEFEIHSITPGECGEKKKSGMSPDSKTNSDEDAIEKGLAAASEEEGETKDDAKEEKAETEKE